MPTLTEQIDELATLVEATGLMYSKRAPTALAKKNISRAGFTSLDKEKHGYQVKTHKGVTVVYIGKEMNYKPGHEPLQPELKGKKTYVDFFRAQWWYKGKQYRSMRDAKKAAGV